MTHVNDLFGLLPDLPWPQTAALPIDEQIREVRRRAGQAREQAAQSIRHRHRAAEHSQANRVTLRSSDASNITRRIARMHALLDALPADTAEQRKTAGQLRKDLLAVTSFLKRSG
jgi:hypothetical protein